MCTVKMRELKMKRGYTDVIFLMRAYNVRTDVIGYELLQVAIMTYLSNPDYELSKLLSIALENAPMSLQNDDECLEKIKEALQNVNIVKLIDEDSEVFNFIKNIAASVRMKELIEIRDISKGLNANDRAKAAFCTVALRKMSNQKDGFTEILNYVAGKHGYENIEEDLLIDLYSIVKKNNYKEKLRLYVGAQMFEKKCEIIKKVKDEVEELVEVFIKEQENLIF